MSEKGFIIPNFSKEEILSVLTKDDIALGMSALGNISKKDAMKILENDDNKEYGVNYDSCLLLQVNKGKTTSNKHFSKIINNNGLKEIEKVTLLCNAA